MPEEKQEEKKVEPEFDDSGRCLKCHKLAGGDPNHKCEVELPDEPDLPDAGEEEVPETPAKEAKPQMELFPGVKRVEKKMKKGKKITQQEAFRVMVELKDAVTHLDGRLQYVGSVMQMLDDGVMKIHANISVLAAVLEDKEIVTPEECEAKYQELKAESEARLKAEKEAAEKEKEGHPDCHYCGLSECEFCNAAKEEKESEDKPVPTEE